MIRASGDPEVLLSLLDWCRHDDALRGQVKAATPQIEPGRMGDIYSVLTAAVSAAGVAPALMKSLTTWLTMFRSDVTLTIERDGTKLEVDAKRVQSAEFLRELRDLLEPRGSEE